MGLVVSTIFIFAVSSYAVNYLINHGNNSRHFLLTTFEEERDSAVTKGTP